MKIGIVTHYGVHNHGAQLQLFALISILRSKEFSVHALQFEKDYRYMDDNAKNKYSVSIKSVPFYLKFLFQNGLKKTLFNVKKKKIFDSFRAYNKILGQKYNEFDGDLLIVGSDEVFSFETGVTDAFWGINSKCKAITAYSASFGPTTFDEIKSKNLESFVSQSIKNFKMISARDKNTKEIIETCSELNVPLTCDPVILYGYKNEIAGLPRKIKEDYILLYSYDKNMNEQDEIKMIQSAARHFKLPVYSIGFYHKWCDKNFNSDPIELLSYFKYAKYIITDTFHGTVLSLITGSLFATFIRKNSNKLYNLLSEYNLQNRIFKDSESCIAVLDKNIDYEYVDGKINDYRTSSMNYLNSVLDSVK